MEHQTKLVLVVVLLVAIVVVLGFTVSKEGLTGGAIVGSIACFEDSDCDDGISATKDMCKNAGTTDALCFNSPD